MKNLLLTVAVSLLSTFVMAFTMYSREEVKSIEEPPSRPLALEELTPVKIEAPKVELIIKDHIKFLDDKEITNFPMYKRAQNGIGYLAQESSIFRKMSVEDNIHSVLEMTNLSKKEQIEKVESLLDEFGLQAIRKSRGDLLSGGERRRTEIARALATNPSFILLDEPFAGVDPLAVEDIQKIVRDLTKRNIGILITDHNVQETLAITDRTYLMFEGTILKDGKPEDLANDELVRKVYLGQNFELRKKTI